MSDEVKLTPADIQLIAERDGWVLGGDWWRKGVIMIRSLKSLDYAHSRDALAPVLGKLTESEWDALCVILDKANPAHAQSFITHQIMTTIEYLLTLPPSTLAQAVADVLRAAKEAKA